MGPHAGRAAPLKGHAALDSVVRKALAKDREDRYGTCAELVEAAAAALGLSAPPATRRPHVPPVVRRRAHLILAAGLVLLAGVIALVIVGLTGGDGAEAEPIGNGVAAIDPTDGGVDSFTESRTAPGNVAVGEGGVWALNNEERTVSRIDPETGEVTKTFRTRGVPSELAVGAGRSGSGPPGGPARPPGQTRRCACHVDPDSGHVTRTARLRGDEGVYPVAGAPRIAVGAGAVWAANPDGSVSRIDAKTGRIVATIDTDASAWTIAAGDEGVWFLGSDDNDYGAAVTRIDPRTNQVTQRIPVGANNLVGVAVGAGSVGGGKRRGRRLADRAPAAAAPQDDRRRQGGELRRLRRGRRLDRQLR